MDYRILELVINPESVLEARSLVEEEGILGAWHDELEDGMSVLRVLTEAGKTEHLSDMLTEKFGHTDGFRIMLISVEATLPQPESEEGDTGETKGDEEKKNIVGRISREELLADVTSGSDLDWVYVGMVVLSTLVAGVGLVRDDVAVIIGAMVIAPLLGPNVSMALAATLGDLKLGMRSLKANAAGLFSSIGVALLMGLIMHVDLESEQIMSRTMVNMGDITIALAAGSAGVLAFTRGVPATIVGVMVAVALLPPLVNVGLLFGAGYTGLALGSIILTLTNLICINLAGIVTFLVQGVQPRRWWEAEKAKKASRTAIAIWFVLLVILAVIIWYWNLSVNPF